MTDLLNPYASRAKRTVEVEARFPGSAIPTDVFNNPRTVTLLQKMKSHDILTLTYEVELQDATRLLKTGSPIQLAWGTTNVGETQSWVGYVHTVTSRKTGNASGTTSITCVSPSMILKQGGQNTWVNRPVMEVASEIANLGGLDMLADPHPLTDNILQHGRTYWQVLRDIATLTGYSLTTDNTQIIMLPHKTFYDLYAARARVFTPGASLEITPKNNSRTLYSFVPDWSDLSEDEYASHVSMTNWAVDPRSGNIEKARSDYPTGQISSTREYPLVDRYSNRAAHNIAEAQRLSSDALANKRWVNQATMTALGSPDISPYKPVYVDEMNNDVNGWWQVLEVEHHIQGRTEYTVSMRVGRDGGPVAYPKPALIPALPESEVTIRAVSDVNQRKPKFITSTESSIGLTGFADINGRWMSSST